MDVASLLALDIGCDGSKYRLAGPGGSGASDQSAPHIVGSREFDAEVAGARYWRHSLSVPHIVHLAFAESQVRNPKP